MKRLMLQRKFIVNRSAHTGVPFSNCSRCLAARERCSSPRV